MSEKSCHFSKEEERGRRRKDRGRDKGAIVLGGLEKKRKHSKGPQCLAKYNRTSISYILSRSFRGTVCTCVHKNVIIFSLWL